jgi:hypothetical protein
VVLATRSEDEGSMSRDCRSGITVRNGGDALVEFCGPVIEDREGSGKPDGASTTGNSDDEYDVAKLLADEMVAKDNIASFATGIGTVLREVDVCIPINDVPVGDGSDAGSSMSEEDMPVLGQYPLGNLPEMNTDVPQDQMRGFRDFKRAWLSSLTKKSSAVCHPSLALLKHCE